ncbi:UpxY family transcription antiterminator [Mucilaginibacter pallidiroseus]|uniref:UpxY family transcription antiterminator n=1 Tax=Mucilaginibacter pallidiroseus TaxID=2599295 RepID=A0A563UHS4_9SPHI|nr:UpxY family transcription antiterminator [Mucilaginibacter pallidiroseus]TWR30917.1 UpxY family transcription antiterminator [Mucilaginibacter pallidiroseus]
MINLNNPNWMVLYTKSKWEKKVDRLLKDQNIISYCPLIKTTKKWVDRNKTVEIPLFNSYLFVYATPRELEKIVQTSGVVTYITFCGKPAVVQENEIKNIKRVISSYSDLEAVPLNSLQVGDEALITGGLWDNYMGAIDQINGKTVVMVIKSMNYALTIKVDSNMILPATKLK